MISFLKRRWWACAGIIVVLVISFMVFLIFLIYWGSVVLQVVARKPVTRTEVVGTYKADILDTNYSALASDEIIVRADGTYTEKYIAAKDGSTSKRDGEWYLFGVKGKPGYFSRIGFSPALLSFNKDSLLIFDSSKPNDSTVYIMHIRKEFSFISFEFDEEGRIHYDKF